MTEGAKAVIKFLFNDVKYRKIIAGCDSENTDSSKVMKKVGMKCKAVLRAPIKRIDGTWDNDLQYGILKREFQENGCCFKLWITPWLFLFQDFNRLVKNFTVRS